MFIPLHPGENTVGEPTDALPEMVPTLFARRPPLSLDTLTLDRIPLLTDVECNALYAELAGQRLTPTPKEEDETPRTGAS